MANHVDIHHDKSPIYFYLGSENIRPTFYLLLFLENIFKSLQEGRSTLRPSIVRHKLGFVHISKATSNVHVMCMHP